ncbi:hypothetical protein TRFO_29808 [Tritrichomonas foetus]|uniref:adenylate cyclase n=1 Tax=Tritrichomonas foetus TaxID=1144522 RepID=A0A1J4JUV1_9EUKA|nr:hypothetical protein TRFO_29808 [Tritrichomonas foetus]|eukprot:OHT02935.1 hypothetical protein TRFO_29808 [Tritrichomonas foetus]
MKQIQTLEHSTISRSSESAVSSNRQMLLSGKSSVVDNVFPLFDNLIQHATLPSFLYHLVTIFFYYQIFLISFSPFNRFWKEMNEDNNNILSYILLIGWTVNTNSDISNATLGIFIVFALCTILFLFEMIHYFRNHRLISWTLYPLRFCLEIVTPIMLHPSAAIFGSAIYQIAKTKEKMNILYAIIGCIMYILFVVYYYFGISLISSSTCINLTHMSTKDYKIATYLPITNSLFVALIFIFALFDDWVVIILQLSHAILVTFFFIPALYLPFDTKIGNTVYLSVSTTIWLSDIIMTALYFIKFNHLYAIVLPFGIFIICFISYFLFVSIRISRVLKSLNISKEDLENDQIRNSVLENTGMLKNENKALMYLRIGFQNYLPLFYTWAISKHVLSEFTSTKTLIQSIQIIGYFPGESRLLNSYFTGVTKHRDLKMPHRFLIYQVNRIKPLRQSSISSEANVKLCELKTLSQQCIEDVISFWAHKTSNAGYFEMVADKNSKVNALWEECIREYPNNSKFYDEYGNFLIESESKLTSAIIQKQKAEFVEMGKNFAVDVPFKSLINWYPQYMKKKIVDINGNILKKNNQVKGKSLSGNSSSSNKNLSSMNVTIDAEIEENIGKQLFKQAPIRIAMNKALANRKSYASKWMLICGAIGMIVGFAAFIALYIYINDYTSVRSDSLVYLAEASNSRFYLDIAKMLTSIKFAYNTNRFPTYELYQNLEKIDEELSQNSEDSIETSNFFKIDNLIDYTIHNNNILSRDYFSNLLDGIATLSNQGENIFKVAEALMVNSNDFYICFQGFPATPVISSLKAQQAYLFFLVELSAGKRVTDTWYQSNEICELLANQQTYNDNYDNLFTSLHQRQSDISVSDKKLITILMIAIPILVLVVNFVPLFIFTRLFIVDVDKLIKTLLSLDNHVKEEARNPIRKDVDFENLQLSDKKPKSKKWTNFTLLFLGASLIVAIICWAMVYLIYNTNTSLVDLNNWQLLSVERLSFVIESVHYVLEAVVLNESIKQNSTNRETLIKHANLMIDKLSTTNDLLLKGNDIINPCYLFDDLLDEINLEEACEVPVNSTDLHDTYRCSSASQGIGIFINIINSVIHDIENTNGEYANVMIPHSIHIINNHLLKRLLDAIDRLNELNKISCSDLETTSIIFLVFGLLLSIIIMALSVCFHNLSVRIYRVGIGLALRVSPASFISKKKLMNFVLNKKNSGHEAGMSITQSIIHMAPDAIICTGISGVVEIVNPAVANTLGFTPDQLLGQPISTFFDEESCSKVLNQLELMKSGAEPLIYEDHLNCMTDNSLLMPCGVTVIAMHNAANTTIGSFVIVIRDETTINAQKDEAESAKNQSDNLLKQILPPIVIKKMNEGEKDITFYAPYASFIYIDICKFGEFSSRNSPNEIFSTLTALYKAFDKVAVNYPELIRLKRIGDAHLAAMGLFNKEEEDETQQALHDTSTNILISNASARLGSAPLSLITSSSALSSNVNLTSKMPQSSQANPSNPQACKKDAELIIKYAFDCLNELEDVNLQLETSLMVRIGINSGGPVMAGLMGFERPSFDAIGDPIGMTIAVQRSGSAGKVTISQSTYDLVRTCDYGLELFGEVKYKKQAIKTYLVTGSMGIQVSGSIDDSSKEIQ